MLFAESANNNKIGVLHRCRKQNSEVVNDRCAISFNTIYELLNDKIYKMAYAFKGNHFFPIDIDENDAISLKVAMKKFEDAFYHEVKKNIDWLKNVQLGNKYIWKKFNKTNFKEQGNKYFREFLFSNFYSDVLYANIIKQVNSLT
jgi:hypothetical protein